MERTVHKNMRFGKVFHSPCFFIKDWKLTTRQITFYRRQEMEPIEMNSPSNHHTADLSSEFELRLEQFQHQHQMALRINLLWSMLRISWNMHHIHVGEGIFLHVYLSISGLLRSEQWEVCHIAWSQLQFPIRSFFSNSIILWRIPFTRRFAPCRLTFILFMCSVMSTQNSACIRDWKAGEHISPSISKNNSIHDFKSHRRFKFRSGLNQWTFML
jgi:hypothetical protein